MLEETIEKIRRELNNLIETSEKSLFEGDVLELSKKLDVLIFNYYKVLKA